MFLCLNFSFVKEDIIAHYLAHTKKWILSQEGQGSRVPTPRHFNVRFMRKKVVGGGGGERLMKHKMLGCLEKKKTFLK